MFKKILLALLFLILPFYLFSDESPNIRLSQLSIKDGLPNGSVSSIIQDRDGFLWFGTQGGLARYDGYTFENFNQDPFNENSLSHNLIQTISMDPDGSIWIGTYDGLNNFDPVTSRFTKYGGEGTGASLSNNIVTSILHDSQGRLWTGTLEGLNLLQDDRSFKHYLEDQAVRAIAETSDGRIWFGTYTGLYVFDEEEKTFKQMLDSTVMAIETDPKNGKLWLGCWDKGIISYNTASTETVHYELPGQNIYTLRFGPENRLWIGSWGQGLTIFNPNDESFITYTTENTSDLSHDIIYSLFKDKSGVMWVGTNGGGLNSYVEWHNRFKYLEHADSNENTISSGKIYSMIEDSDHDIWIGIYNSGINRIDSHTGRITKYNFDPDDQQSLSNDIVNEIMQDSKNRIWVLTNNGFCIYNAEQDNFSRYYNENATESLPDNIFYRIFEDKDGRIWLGTYNAGIIVIEDEPKDQIYFKHIKGEENSLSSNLIRDIIQDRTGRIWIATNSGLNLFQPQTGNFKRFRHGAQGTISNNDIRSLFENKNGSIWAGTLGGGISIYTPKTDSFSYLTKRDGLMNNIITAIEQPLDDEIWIAEEYGISTLSEETGTMSYITNSSGLLDGELTSNLLFTSDETVWCGGVNGITVIPLKFSTKTVYSPEIRITRLEINGRAYKTTRTTIRRGNIILKNNQNNISIDLNSDDYSFPSQNQFTYKLEGFDDDWSIPGKRNYINYTNLPAGHYIFRAKGSGSRNNWSTNELKLDITIKPHPNASIPAILSYILAFIVLMWVIINFVSKKKKATEAISAEQERINHVLEEKVRQRTAEIEDARTIAEEATKAKSLFLANMSHEIRTPLNGIIGMLALMKKTSPNSEQQKYLDYSQISAESLRALLDEILNYEKLKSGNIVMSDAIFSPSEIFAYTKTLYQEQTESKNIEFNSVISPDVPQFLSGDSQKLSRIVNNLVSNAVKYTDAGRITMSFGGSPIEGSFKLFITVEDSGRGIPTEKLSSIFNSFEQLDSSYTKTQRGVGLGLAIVDELVKLMGGTISVKSIPGEGTIFTVNLVLRLCETEPPKENEKLHINSKQDKSLRIMIAEDEAINRLYITKLLKDNSFDFEACSNGREVIEKFPVYKPDIILMDIGMPEINGIEAVETIRKYEAENNLSRAVIIMLSAHVYKDDIEASLKAGADYFLAKPFKEKEFIAGMKKWSQKHD